MDENQNLTIISKLKELEVSDATFFSQPYFVMSKGLGSIIYDAQGKPFIDLCAGFGSLPLGHNHPVYQSIYESYVSKDPSYIPDCVQGLSDAFSSVDKYNLLVKLSKLFPNCKFSFALSGSQIITTALKTAMLYTKGDAFISFKGAYHGLDFGALSVTQRSFFKRPFPNWYGNTYFCDYGSSDTEAQVYSAIKQASSCNQKIAAVILEPVQGRAGTIIPPEGWIQKLADICKELSILLIYDEIFTGLGRTGSLSYSYSVPADIICLGKALGGGLPISVCVGSSKIMDAWPTSKGEAIHTGTFFGHPLSSRFACLTLDTICDTKLDQRSSLVGQKFLSLLHENLSEFDAVKSIRGKGLMISVEFNKPELGSIVSDLLRKQSILCIPEGEEAQCISFTPALNIPEDLLNEVVIKLRDVMKYLY